MMSEESRPIDCVVCGEICVDLAVRPIDRSRPLSQMHTELVDPVLPGTGGIVPNSGMAMSRLGLRTLAFGCIGNDFWGQFLTQRLSDEGVDTSLLVTLDQSPSSVTVVVGGDDGEHSFLFHAGASRRFDLRIIEPRIDIFAESRFALFGYYALMPELEVDLPGVFSRIRGQGCQVALDTSGGGGSMTPLDQILPHVDVYIPSVDEARSQTGQEDPRSMINTYRQYAPDALLGIKLGDQGAVLSPAAGEWIEVDPVTPPGLLIDTTGAGDCFYAGLITGLVRGLSLADAGKLAAAAGACSVTGIGAVAALPDSDALMSIARIRA